MSICSAVIPASIVILALASGPSLAEEAKRFPLSATYKEECGSCHVPYPPQLLSSQSWREIMGGLDRHFGSDASLEPDKAKQIGDFLASNAGRSARLSAQGGQGGVPLRVTETSWFKREHREGHDGITAAVWRSATVKSPSNCGACHQKASQGFYDEDEIRVPRSK